MKNQINKKVKNATRVVIDNINFRSKLEAYTYIKFKEANIRLDYECKRFELLPKFEFQGKKIRAITYLPDFIGNNFIIECKGFKTDTWPLREKLFNYYLYRFEPNIKFYIVHNQKQVDELIKHLKEC